MCLSNSNVAHVTGLTSYIGCLEVCEEEELEEEELKELEEPIVEVEQEEKDIIVDEITDFLVTDSPDTEAPTSL